MQETQVRSIGLEDPLEKEMATHSSIFAWEIQWTEKIDGLQSPGLKRVGYNLATEQQQSPSPIKPEESFSRTWKSFIQNIIIRTGRAFASQSLRENRVLTLVTGS